MHWQKSGDYLCVMVNRYKKILTDNADRKYAGLYYNFEVFHMLEKQIPVDTVKIEETVHAFSWEPIGTKFAIVHGDSQNNNVSFYGVKKGLQQPPELLKKYERKVANCLFWCPTGQFVILAGAFCLFLFSRISETIIYTYLRLSLHYSQECVK